MSFGLNRAQVIGRLGGDATIHDLANGGRVANLSIATARAPRASASLPAKRCSPARQASSSSAFSGTDIRTLPNRLRIRWMGTAGGSTPFNASVASRRVSSKGTNLPLTS